MLIIYSPHEKLTEWAYIYADLLDIFEIEGILEIGHITAKCYGEAIQAVCFDAGDCIKIGLNPDEFKADPSILAHEMIHAKQYLKNELQDFKNFTRFRGKMYRDTDIYDTSQPWEKEAYANQKRLYKKSLKRFNLRN